MNDSKEGVRVQAALDDMTAEQLEGARLLAAALSAGAASAHRSSHARAERARSQGPLIESTAIGAAGSDMQWASFLKTVLQRAKRTAAERGGGGGPQG